MSTTLRAVPASVNGWNADYLQQQYEQYAADASSVPADMQAFFAGFDLAMRAAPSGGVAARPGGVGGGDAREALRLHAGVTSLVDAYRRYGHLAARIDPFDRARTGHPSLELAFHGLGAADIAKQVEPAGVPVARPCTLGQLVEFLRAVYCGPVGVQVMHITDNQQRQWLLERVESSRMRPRLSTPERVAIFEAINKAEQFEAFAQKRYMGKKRFSLEGGETLIPVLDRLILGASNLGAEEVIMGMPHRGRLNVLINTVGKSYAQVFTEFEEAWKEEFADGGGDVKYHKGFSGERALPNGKTIAVALASNPSHLESVAAVVAGRCRAKQRLKNDAERRRVVPIAMHGDAAVIGQGIVAELANMGRLEGYTVGGTLHVVVNNQVGFTTAPEDARSSAYCTDIALQNDSPVFHVNSDDPEAAVAVADLAVEFRQTFRRDAWIDIVCWRKYGHNEQDEPSYTQPVMAGMIKNKASTVAIYAERLVSEGALSEPAMTALRETLDAQLGRTQDEVSKGSGKRPPNIDPGGRRWKGYGEAFSFAPVTTAISAQRLAEVCQALGHAPAGMALHKNVTDLQSARRALGAGTGALSYADAESIAIGSLLLDGVAVRLSGQDCRRGTFSHRHAVIRDQKTGEAFIPLNNMRPISALPDDAGKPGPDGRPTQARLCVYDSPLSEEAVMGFDYGYSLADPNMLVMWEGQFGDFVNGAQVLIDQYIASAEIKWKRWSGLTLLLPHGYEGAGPEHSSCRIERFLQLCAGDNMQVVMPSTGAQVFHLLRRQVSAQRKFRKPLIVATPKSMLRKPTSRVEELLSGSFEELIDDPAFGAKGAKHDRKGVARVILCAGKLYHELAARREATKKFDTALVRVEQFYPFHKELFAEILRRYPAKAELVYCQEEPRNAGAFLFMDDLLRSECAVKALRYIGRPASSTPATGSLKLSDQQQEALIAEAIAPLPKEAGKPVKA
jgi:2-oxoglutarate dehydrogenase E1 component